MPAGTCSLDFGITVPAGLPVMVSSAFGELDARGLHGTVTLADTTGDMSVSGLSGTVHVTDGFGTIAASGLSGRIQLDNNTGDIQAAGVTGDTRLQDSFGAISVTGLAASDVVASNNSGDISLTFTKVPQRVNVTDSFGSITLVLPHGATAYRVETRNSFGSTTVSVPRSPSARNVITASDNSGDITICHPEAPGAPARAGRACRSLSPGQGDRDAAGGLDRSFHHARVHIRPGISGWIWSGHSMFIRFLIVSNQSAGVTVGCWRIKAASVAFTCLLHASGT